MSFPLLTGNFEWVENILDQLYTELDSPMGYIYEMDLEYPGHPHDLHNCCPLAPVHNKVENVRKLLATSELKTKYVVHYHSLEEYLELGLNVTNIHGVLVLLSLYNLETSIA